MRYEINGKEYNLEIVRKNNKRMYLRVKDDLTLYVTANYLTSDREILRFLDSNQDFLIDAIKRVKKHQEKDNDFYLFGKKYDIIIDSKVDKIYLSGNKIYVSSMDKFNKWLKKETMKLYKEHLDIIYNKFDKSLYVSFCYINKSLF